MSGRGVGLADRGWDPYGGCAGKDMDDWDFFNQMFAELKACQDNPPEECRNGEAQVGVILNPQTCSFDCQCMYNGVGFPYDARTQAGPTTITNQEGSDGNSALTFQETLDRM